MLKLGYTLAITIRRSPDDVFAFLTGPYLDPPPDFPYARGVIEHVTGLPLHQGSRWAETTRDAADRQVRSEFEVLECDPPSKLAMSGTSTLVGEPVRDEATTARPAKVTPFGVSYGLEAVPEGTLCCLKYEARFNVGPAWAVVLPLWRARLRESTLNRMYLLRDYLEQQGGLPRRGRPRQIGGAVRFWAVYALVWFILLALYLARSSLGLSAATDFLRTTLSALVTVAFVAALLYGVWVNPQRRSKQG